MGINNFRTGFQARTEMVKDENDNLITDSTRVLLQILGKIILISY